MAEGWEHDWHAQPTANEGRPGSSRTSPRAIGPASAHRRVARRVDRGWLVHGSSFAHARRAHRRVARSAFGRRRPEADPWETARSLQRVMQPATRPAKEDVGK